MDGEEEECEEEHDDEDDEDEQLKLIFPMMLDNTCTDV